MTTTQSHVTIDFERVIDLVDKKYDGRTITPDMIAACVIWTRFAPNNERSQAIKEVKETILSVRTKYFDQRYGGLLKKYKNAWKS